MSTRIYDDGFVSAVRVARGRGLVGVQITNAAGDYILIEYDRAVDVARQIVRFDDEQTRIARELIDNG